MRVGINFKETKMNKPIIDEFNTPESMAAVFAAYEKQRNVKVVIDYDHIAAMAAIPDDVWATCKPE